MGDVIDATLRDFAAMLRFALHATGPWYAAAAVLGTAVLAAAVRGKLSSPWAWIPLVAGAAYWVVYQYLRLQW